MKKHFDEIMSKRSEEELIEIITILRKDYQPEAVNAAERELHSRDVNPERIETLKKELGQSHQDQMKLESQVVTPWLRLVHFIVDMLVFFLLAVVLSILTDLFLPTTEGAETDVIMWALFLMAFLLYYVFMEFKFQRTVGKFFTKSKVVRCDGSQPDFNEIFIRTLCRLIPFDRVSYIFWRNGIHDRFSNTIVIKENKSN